MTRRRVVSPEPRDKSAKLARLPGAELQGTLSDAVVVPHELEQLADVRIILAEELRLLRLKRQSGTTAMDHREVHRMTKLVEMLERSQRMQQAAEAREQPGMTRMSDEELEELAGDTE